ncbi:MULTISPECIES: MalY/PatB family protein [Chryseobacterium]|uniref:MalY/PatB family protein n=1 Tax=Chryseobacterium TaxID=59732 RepID=UPI0019570EE9|nr:MULTISPECIES: MalY/PatB family protein [Chryseobacterium]MBM7421327.1 cystathionine beta-lyase [Chryseobacterium sp. JUb44]MDH6211288.1 cystathionine beta-lyase [Chryseobacterium sp. BIGb0186]WSO09947.1 MalY/PatB family protein [Chryseobacterium scophthalmum]
MPYNFDEIISRRNSNSYKWDTAKDEDVLPMWVADMDFRTAQPVIDALAKRVAHGIFGYSKVPQAYFDATISWFQRRHHFTIEKEWLLFTSGVVPALSAIIKALTNAGDKVLVQTPVYNCFFSSIRNDECQLVTNELVYHNGRYSIDFDDLEKKSADPDVKLMILCNPHNPVGRVWSREELTRIGEICISNNVIVVSDEIHCDLTYENHQYIPFASINKTFLQNSVTCIAPTKTFNMAGIQVANIVAENENIRKKIDKALNVNEVCEINVFAVEALIAAYNDGEEWLEELKVYLRENYNILSKFFKEKLPHLTVLPLEATYLGWIDCTALEVPTSEIVEKLLQEQKLWLNDSAMYGDKEEKFIRINIACPRQLLNEGLSRIYNVLKQ